MEKQFDRSSFMKVLWKLMLPIVLQNLLSAVVSTADVLMLTHVSQTALAAHSRLCGTLYGRVFQAALCSAEVPAVQVAQKSDRESIRRKFKC